MLDEKMRAPGECVADDETEREIIPCAAPDEPDEQQDAEKSSGKMQNARQRLAVFPHVEIPEFFVSFDSFHKLLS